MPPKAKGYSGARTEPVQTPSGYPLKPLLGREVKALKKILTKNFEAVQQKLKAVEQERLELQEELGPDVELSADQSAGMAIVEIILEDAFDQAWAWLGDMIGKDIDYEPWSAHIEIIETLVEEDDFPNYVERRIKLRRTFSNVFATRSSSATTSQNGS